MQTNARGLKLVPMQGTTNDTKQRVLNLIHNERGGALGGRSKMNSSRQSDGRNGIGSKQGFGGRNYNQNRSSNDSGWDQSATTGDTVHNQFQYAGSGGYMDAMPGMMAQRPTADQNAMFQPTDFEQALLAHYKARQEHQDPAMKGKLHNQELPAIPPELMSMLGGGQGLDGGKKQGFTPMQDALLSQKNRKNRKVVITIKQ